VAARPAPALAGRAETLKRLALAAASGILCGLAFPPTSWKALAWVGLVPLLVALHRARPLRAAVVCGAWGLVFWTSVWEWGPEAVSFYFLQPPAVGWAFLLGIALVMLVPYVAAFGAVHSLLARRYALSLPLWAGAAWAALELLRVRPPVAPDLLANPWALLGISQAGVSPVVQMAAATGIYGVSFALVSVNAALAELVVARSERRVRAGEVLARLGVGALPAALVLAYGAVALHGAERPEGEGAVEVALVQGNVDVSTRWRPQLRGRQLDTYLRLTQEAFAAGSPELVFWPEAAMTFPLEEEGPYRWAIGRVLERGGAELVAGSPRRSRTDPPRHFNSIYAIEPGGEIRAHYDKEHLLPFTERFPWAHLDLVRRSFGEIRELSAGPPGQLLPTRAGAAGVVICNEAMFPHLVAERVEAGAEYLVNPSNDGWVPDPEFALHQFDLVSLRAVEQRRYLVRSSTSGPSAVVDPWGRSQDRLPPFTQGIVSGHVRTRQERSLYGRVGDLFGTLCGVGVLAALLYRRPLSGARAW
jgi:apolipoprotein N-acyltransferase